VGEPLDVESDAIIPYPLLEDHDAYRTFCLKRAAARKGYDVTDLAWYSTETLAELVEAVLGAFTPTPQGDGRGNNDPAEGWNVQAALADVQRALYKLMSPEHRAVLMLHHSGYLEASDESLQAAYTDLQGCLGGRRPKGLLDRS